MLNDIFSTIQNRISCRTFTDQLIEPEKIDSILTAVQAINAPFGSKIRFVVCDETTNGKSVKKLSTYGTIKGAKKYITAAVTQGDTAAEDFGYIFEAVILKATELGLGTCWLGGTFAKSQFAIAMGLKSGEVMQSITPIGYPASKKSFADRITRRIAGSDNRNPWSNLFFANNFQTELNQNDCGEYKKALEMVRLGPSASNKQPWRIVLEKEKGYHFFVQRFPGYNVMFKTGKFADLPKGDVGIAMYHFEQSALALNLKGCWKKITPNIGAIPEQKEYVASWLF